MSQDADVDTPTEKNTAEVLSETGYYLSKHLVKYLNIQSSYRRSNSLVLRKFRIGAKAVGSRSINICGWRNILTDVEII